MKSQMNLVTVGNSQSVDVSGPRPPEASPLFRQSSIYSLTFDELQNTIGGGTGKDFGSMNMDELLKNIWTAEESQMMTNLPGGSEVGEPGINLQRQGSLTLSRTLSQMTVDEVWRDLMKGVSREVERDVASNLPQKQPILGEITLEEFLLRAGVVKENQEQTGALYNDGFFTELSQVDSSTNSNNSLLLGYQQPCLNNSFVQAQNGDNVFAPQSSIGFNGGDVKPTLQTSRRRRQLEHQQPLFPKPARVVTAAPLPLSNGGQLASSGLKYNLMPTSGVNAVGIGGGDIKAAKESSESRRSPNLIPKSDVDSASPFGVTRGRRSATGLEKVIERRQRRMIKNRESAARSRARKQAYTLELEAEVAKLKELNQELERKQNEILAVQRCQMLEPTNRQLEVKRQRLRRTFTGPW